MKTAILIPCYNESMTIKKVINDFQNVLPDADIYVYDNNSTDGTGDISRSEGAIVRYEYNQGKGNVVRSMFRDIDADCYIMVDGDDTYPAEVAVEIEKLVLEGKADMVIGDRLSSTYFTENKRPFHNTGNKFMRKAINTIFSSDLHDILTGMRGFNYEFVKSYPVISKGFELETEMSIFALDHNFKIAEIPIDYRDRMEGSESKLNTYSDGYKVIKVIITLFRDSKPLAFFSIITGILVIIALYYFIPILINYLYTGYVLRIPTLIVAAVTFLTAVMIFLSGLILQVLKKQHDQDFEHQLTLIRLNKQNRDEF